MKNIEIINGVKSLELKQRDILKSINNPKDIYRSREIPWIFGFLFILILPLCCIDLFIVRKYKYFFINIIRNDLTDEIKKNYLNDIYSTDRLGKIRGKFFIFPLRVYSHLVRGEWIFPDIFNLSQLLELFLEKYLIFFIRYMRHKVYFIKEDYHAETSMIASIGILIKEIVIVSFQHEAMNLSDVSKNGFYPGKRASIQIVHDGNTEKTFLKCNDLHPKIVKSIPCYKYLNVNFDGYIDVVFIGNGSKSVRNIAFNLLSIFSMHHRVGSCIYVPYFKEKIIAQDKNININIQYQKDYFDLISNDKPKIFIGAISTALYDACMAGHKVILLNYDEILLTDSLFTLKAFTKLSISDDPLKILDIEINSTDFYVQEDFCLNVPDIVNIIESRVNEQL